MPAAGTRISLPRTSALICVHRREPAAPPTEYRTPVCLGAGLLRDRDVVEEGEGDALHDGPPDRGLRGAEAEAEEEPLGVGVPDGAALALEVGQEPHSVGADRDALGVGVDPLEGVLRAAEGVARPVQRGASGDGAALEEPGAGHDVAGEDEALVAHRRVGDDRHAAGLAPLLLGLSRPHDAGPERPAGGVETPGDDRRARGQPGRGGGLGGDGPDDLVAGHRLREPGEVEAELGRQRLVVLACGGVPGVDAVGLGDVLGDPAGQAQDDKGAGLEEPASRPVDLRPVALEPDDLAGGVGGGQPVARHCEDAVRADARDEVVADVLAARVHPDGGVGEHRAVGIDGDGRPGLAGDADAGDAVCADRLDDGPSGQGDGLPPLVRILFDEAGGIDDEAVVAGLVGQDGGVPGEGGDLRRGCADVNADEDVLGGAAGCDCSGTRGTHGALRWAIGSG